MKRTSVVPVASKSALRSTLLTVPSSKITPATKMFSRNSTSERIGEQTTVITYSFEPSSYSSPGSSTV